MKRFAMDKLLQWKNRNDRKPLIILGAHQVGKTWLMKEFANIEYKDNFYIDFSDNDQVIHDLFAQNLKTKQLLAGLETHCGKEIDPKNTLIIFDEVQKMIQSMFILQSINDDTQNYHIICASSWSDTALCTAAPFLAGNVEFLHLYPLSFQEFFLEVEQREAYKNYLCENKLEMTSIFKKEYDDILKKYFFVGGMPEAVSNFLKYGDWDKVREVQKRILNDYEQNFLCQTSSALSSKINLVWKSIPLQLAKINKKFFYGLIQEGGRAKTYKEAITWLIHNGFVYKINRTAPLFPLKDNENMKVFKLFAVDIGLLGCMFGLHYNEFFDGNTLFDKFEGALTEQYVLQQLITIPNWNFHYYENERCACEINFLFDNGRLVIPIEIRMKINSKAKRLKIYQEKFQPEKLVQVTESDYYADDKMFRLPLYAVEKTAAILQM